MIPEIMANATKELKDLTKEAFQDHFKKWKHCWGKCVRQGEEYCKVTRTQIYVTSK